MGQTEHTPTLHLQRYPLLSYECIPLTTLSSEALIIHPRQADIVLYDGFIQLCQTLGFQSNIVQEATSFHSRVCLVAAGIGITFVPESAQALVGPDVMCRPLADCPISLQFAAAWRPKTSAPTLREFLAILMQ